MLLDMPPVGTTRPARGGTSLLELLSAIYDFFFHDINTKGAAQAAPFTPWSEALFSLPARPAPHTARHINTLDDK